MKMHIKICHIIKKYYFCHVERDNFGYRMSSYAKYFITKQLIKLTNYGKSNCC